MANLSVLPNSIMIYSCILLLAIVPFTENAPLNNDVQETGDAWLNISQIIASRGFRPEIHQVTTEDGYILTLHRVVNPLIPPNELINRKPILLLTGMITSVKVYVIHTKGKLQSNGVYVEEDGKLVTNCNADPRRNESTNTNTHAFVLSSCGYDVWMGDIRGSYDCLGHVNMSYTAFKYWRFSLQEVGWYDFPAMINHILTINRSGKINLIALSQTTTATMFYLTSHPKIEKPVNLAILTGTAVYMHYILDVHPVIKPMASSIRSMILPAARALDYLLREFAGPIPIRALPNSTFPIVGNLLQYVIKILESYGIDIWAFLRYFNPAVSSVNSDQGAAFATIVDNTSSWIISHLIQTFVTARFSYHDRGESENKKLYNVTTAPDVPLEKITNKVCIIYGREDFSGNPKSIGLLKTKMKIYYDYLVPKKIWMHGDYISHHEVDRYILPQYLYLLENN